MEIMSDNIISDIKFTQTEIKVLSCFVAHVIKSKQIGVILGSSPKTIDSHIDNIKRKINAYSKEEIIFFVKKSKQFHQLEDNFDRLYVDHQYAKVAKTISHNLASMDISCSCSISPELTKNKEVSMIREAIKLMGIKVDTVNDVQSLLETDTTSNSHKFVLFIFQNMSEIDNLRKHTDNKHDNVIYICIDKKLSHPHDDSNVLLYDANNKKFFYHFLINYLIKNYEIIDSLNKQSDFISSINVLKKSSRSNEEALSNTSNNTRSSSLFSHKLWIAALFVVIVTVSYIIHNRKDALQETQIITGSSTDNLQEERTSGTLVYNLPPRNINFIGRRDIFSQIKNNLDSVNIEVATQTIIGAGGIGKTQLLAEYAYRAIEKKEYDAILWLNAQTPNSIDNLYSDLATKLKLNITNLNSAAVRKLIHNELLNKHKIKKILFILDSAPKKKDVEQYIAEIRSQLPIISMKVHILISSRSQYWPGFSLTLDTFTKEEAKFFVEQHLPHEQEQDILNLIESLNYYPLALGQAVGYVKKHTNIRDYLELYSDRKQLYLDKFADNQYTASLWSILNITLSGLSNDAKSILYISSYLDPEDIPLEFFDYLPTVKRSKAIKELRDHSMITLTNHRSSFKIHALLQEIIRLKIQDQTRWINEAAMLAKKDIDYFNIHEQSTWNKARKWLLHINPLYNHMQKMLETAKLLDRYGVVAQHFGLYKLAYNLFLESLNIKIIHYKSESHIKLVNTLDKLGAVALQLDQYDKAIDLSRRSLNIKEEHYKTSEHIDLVDTLIILGKVESKLGHYEAASDIFERALSIKENYYQNTKDINLVDILFNIGNLELYFGHYELSKKVFQRIFNIKENYYKDPEHIELSDTLNDLGLVELYLGHWREAKDFHVQALNIRKKHNKNIYDLSTVRSLHNLGVTEWGLGNYEGAEKLYDQALNIKQEYYQNANHITLAPSLLGLGLVEYAKGNYAKAKQYLNRDLAIRNAHYQNPDHIALSSSLHTLGVIEEALGNYNTALEHIKKSYKVRNKHYKDRLHHIMASEYTPVTLWHILEKTKDPSAVIKYYQESLIITEKLFGNNHHFTARYHFLLAQAYYINKQYKEASTHYKVALNIAMQAKANIKDDTLRAGHQKNIELIKTKMKNLLQAS